MAVAEGGRKIFIVGGDVQIRTDDNIDWMYDKKQVRLLPRNICNEVYELDLGLLPLGIGDPFSLRGNGGTAHWRQVGLPKTE